MPRAAGRYRAHAALPPERSAPFLLTRDGDDLVLITPFASRRSGLAPAEVALTRDVVAHLRGLATPGSPIWIDPTSGAVIPASIGEGQLRRRLNDCASFEVRMAFPAASLVPGCDR